MTPVRRGVCVAPLGRRRSWRPWSAGGPGAARSSTASGRSTRRRWRRRGARLASTTVACAWRWRLVAAGSAWAIAGRRRWRPATARSSSTPPARRVLGDVHRGRAARRAVGDTGRALRAVAWERARRPGRPGRARGRGAARCCRRRCSSRSRWSPDCWPSRPGGRAGGARVLAPASVPDWSAAWHARARRRPRAALLVRRRLARGGASRPRRGRRPATWRPSSSPRAPPASTLRSASCCRSPCSCWSPPGCPLNVAGWGPREGVAAWVLRGRRAGRGPGRRDRRRVRRDGAGGEPARAVRAAGRRVGRADARTAATCGGRWVPWLSVRTPC